MVLLALLPMIMAKNLKGRIRKSRAAEAAFLKENLKSLPDEIIQVSKGYIVNSGAALKSIVKINMIKREMAAAPDAVPDGHFQILVLTKNLVEGARLSPRLLRNPRFIALNNRFEEIDNVLMNGRFRCAVLTRRLLRLKALPLYGGMIDIDDIRPDLCAE
jgi:hypothetical protein